MDVDITLLIQLAILCIVLLLLNSLLLKPVLQVIENRHRRIDGAKEEAERLVRITSDDRVAYETRMRAARREAQGEREALRTTGRERERKLLADVRADIARQLNDTRDKIGAAELEAHRALSEHTEALARRLVEKVLGRKVGT